MAPRLIDDELNRRLEAAQNAAPTKRRQDALQRDLARVRKSMERLMTAYQEDLVSLDELRSRMPDLRQREQAAHAELQSITTQAQDRASYLRLAETLAAFLGRLRSSAETLDILERQRIVRLLVKEILVADDAITIRHSIPVTANSPHNEEPPKSSKFGASKHDRLSFAFRAWITPPCGVPRFRPTMCHLPAASAPSASVRCTAVPMRTSHVSGWPAARARGRCCRTAP